MRIHSLFRYGVLATLLSFVTAANYIKSNTLEVLQPGKFSATSFEAIFSPDNGTASFSLQASSGIEGFITLGIVVVVYGYEIDEQTVIPCNIKGMTGFCPLHSGPLDLPFTRLKLSEDVIGEIPNIGFTVPDLDASVLIRVYNQETGDQITAVEAVLFNGKTVYQTGVGWAVAILSGLALAASIFVSIRGHSIGAAHLVAYTSALFGFMQSQAMVGMLATPLPPIVRSWTQNFQWTMGVVSAPFLERISTWYVRSTGGTTTTVLEDDATKMIDVLKRREWPAIEASAGNTLGQLVKRADTAGSNLLVVRGLDRVAWRAQIEESNLFVTSIIIFGFVFVVATVLALGWKAVGIIASKKGKKLGPGSVEWNLIAKGILYRLLFIGFAPICIFCLWEFTQKNSPAAIVVAVFTLLSVVGTVGWAALRIILSTRRSVTMDQYPAYLLLTEKAYLHQYGFLYVQYNAKLPFFGAAMLGYLFLKALFISFAQPSPNAQAIAFFIIETAMLLAVSILRPWMDKKTNGFNITIAAINFLNSLFLLFFSGIFGQPKIVASVMGVILFVVNAALTLVLLVLVIVSAVRTIFFNKSSDTVYKPVQEHTGSRVQSSTRLTHTAELDELAQTARGEQEVRSEKDRNSVLL